MSVADACLGAVLVFQLGLGRLRGWARRRLAASPKLQAVEAAVSREGLRLVLLTRLAPSLPRPGRWLPNRAPAARRERPQSRRLLANALANAPRRIRPTPTDPAPPAR